MFKYASMGEGAARINGVYTPTEQRRKSYASKSLDTFCRTVLLGDFREHHGPKLAPMPRLEALLLFTDLDNATTNHIYPQIGFKPLGDYLHLDFHY
jgi:predicted GNAT family acetyltransferase